MGYLRDRLKQGNPELYRSFEDCLARSEQWVSAMGHKNDSFNSRPHLLNVERHMDRILEQLSAQPQKARRLELSDIEIYIALLSVLFHDIGRLKTDLSGKGAKRPSASGNPQCVLLCQDQQLQDALRKDPASFIELFQERGATGDYDQCKSCARQAAHLDALLIQGKRTDLPITPYEFHKPSEQSSKDFCHRQCTCPLFCLICQAQGWNTKILQRMPLPPNEHPVDSFLLLQDNKVYPQLGIASPEIARSVAKICLYHGRMKDIEGYYDSEMLNTVFIDPHGKVREFEIATLLKLSDFLDSAYTRVFPHYLRYHRNPEVVGRFREKIRGVGIVPEARMVITNLTDWTLKHEEFEFLKQPLEDLTGESFHTDRITFYIGLKHIYEAYHEIKPGSLFWDIFCACRHKVGVQDSSIAHMTLTQRVMKDMHAVFIPWTYDSYVSVGPYEIRVERFQDCVKQLDDLLKDIAANIVILNIIQRDIHGNLQVLNELRPTLNGMGLRLYAWVIEYQDHLYNAEGRETFEPVFDNEYLEKTAHYMWKLSTEIFGQSQFGYQTLASAIREPDIDKVRLAVRRIRIITRNMPGSLLTSNIHRRSSFGDPSHE